MVVLLCVVMRGDGLLLIRSGRKKEKPNVVPVVLVVLMDLSSCSTGRQGHVVMTEEKNFSLSIGRQKPKIKRALIPLPVGITEALSTAFGCAWGVCVSAGKMQR